MTRRWLILITLLLAALCGPPALPAAAQLPTNSYTVTDLGHLGGGGTVPYDVNDTGQVVGTSRRADGWLSAFLWQNGSMIDLGGLPGGGWSRASAINTRGQIGGAAWGPNP